MSNKKPILEIYCDGGECLWFHDENGNLDRMPETWKEDKVFMDLYHKMCGVYMSLFDFSKLPYYQGFRDEKHKQETKELFDSFTAYINKINNGQYEIINRLDIENP